MRKLERIAMISVVIGLVSVQTLWGGWANFSDGLLERDANRLEAARKNHVSDVERAFNVYSNQVDRANSTLTRIYEQVIRTYENRGDQATAGRLKSELVELTAKALKMPFPDDEEDKDKNREIPPNSHAQLIQWIGPEVVNSSGNRAPSARIAQYDYILLYYTAGWCGPCRRFTPQLIQFYNENRSHGRWEIVVVSGDRSESAFYDYLSEAEMPWAAVPYDRLSPSGLVERYPGGWPRMVVLDREAKTILSAVGGSQSMLNEFRQLLSR